jgi:hypothetical protein
MSYNLTTLRSTKGDDGTIMKTFQIYKKNKRFITSNELHKLVDNLYKKNPNADFKIKGNGGKIPKGLTEDEIKIRVLAPDMWRSAKSYGKDLKYDNEADYLEGKVKETAKFMKYYQIELTIIIPPKQKKKSKKS